MPYRIISTLLISPRCHCKSEDYRGECKRNKNKLKLYFVKNWYVVFCEVETWLIARRRTLANFRLLLKGRYRLQCMFSCTQKMDCVAYILFSYDFFIVFAFGFTRAKSWTVIWIFFGLCLTSLSCHFFYFFLVLLSDLLFSPWNPHFFCNFK